MKRITPLLILLSLMIGCTNKSEHMKQFDLQGHRGCRGLLPENTIPAFLKAIDLGVTTLEMDLAVTKDGELLVSHEPYMSAEICLDSAGLPIVDSMQYQYNIYQMTHKEIQQFDCGLRPHPRFPEQKKMAVSKPMLADVVKAVNESLNKKDISSINYNIEIKSLEEGDNVYHPTHSDFSDLVYRSIDGMIDWQHVTIQSFDFRVLQYFNSTYPDVKLALLIENELTFDQNLDSLGFKPDIYSCWFKLLDEDVIADLQSEGIQVIPWTVNEVKDMNQLIDWGVDGLITDYPNRFKL